MEISVKLDRITVTGKIIKVSTSLIELQRILVNTRWEQVSDYEFQLRRQNENGVMENVAGLFANPHQASSWRLDTSNHLRGDELQQILVPISNMIDAHLTRIDVAFDIKNGTLPNMAHRIYRFNSTERSFGERVDEYTGRAKQIQTIYAGTRKSEKQIRYYDKIAEQKSRRKKIPEGIRQWERLEIQLRGSSVADWKLACRQMLSIFKMPNIKSVENPQERAMLFALSEHMVEWPDLSKASQAKFRKMLREDQGLNDEYSQLLLTYFDEHVDDLNAEIAAFVAQVLPNQENK